MLAKLAMTSSRQPEFNAVGSVDIIQFIGSVSTTEGVMLESTFWRAALLALNER